MKPIWLLSKDPNDYQVFRPIDYQVGKLNKTTRSAQIEGPVIGPRSRISCRPYSRGGRLLHRNIVTHTKNTRKQAIPHGQGWHGRAWWHGVAVPNRCLGVPKCTHLHGLRWVLCLGSKLNQSKNSWPWLSLKRMWKGKERRGMKFTD